MDPNNPASNPPSDPSQSSAPPTPPDNTSPAAPAPAPEAPPTQASPYTNPSSTGQFGSFPPATGNLPPDSFGSASAPYTPTTPAGVTPTGSMDSSLPSSPQVPASPEVATTPVNSGSGKKLWMIIIPIIILLLGGGGAAAYFLLASQPTANQPTPDYTITPREIPETSDQTIVPEPETPAQSGFSDTENQIPAETTVDDLENLVAPPPDQTSVDPDQVMNEDPNTPPVQ